MRNKEGLVDDLITSIPGEWKFDEQVSQHFDTYVLGRREYSGTLPESRAVPD